MNYEYKFVRIKLELGIFADKPREEYHDVIWNHAAEGWRLVQVFAPGTFMAGKAEYFEVIFERPLK